MKSSTRNQRRSYTDFLLHLHPRFVPQQTLRLSLSWGLGGMAAVLVGLLFLSGVLLLFTYQPSVEQAYRSILTLTRTTPFGLWVRNIHHFSANLLVIVAVLHLLRVVLTGALGPGRRLNWLIGLLLLFILLAGNFTGYLLPWDQLSYWAVTICTSMLGYIPLCGPWLQELFRGGAEIGAATLANFFVLHVAFVPASLFILLPWHFWLVRRAGGLVQAERPAPKQLVPSVPNLLVREAAVGLVLIAAVLLLAIFWDAPLLEQANPGMSPNPAKAPWYFLGFQELLLHLEPVFAVLVWPLLGIAGLALIPFWRDSALPPGVWFGSARSRILAIWTVAITAFGTLAIILADNQILTSGSGAVGAGAARGWLPTGLLLLTLAGQYLLLRKKLQYTRAEAVMAGFLLLLVALTVCTIIGIWFRGPEMRLVFFQ